MILGILVMYYVLMCLFYFVKIKYCWISEMSCPLHQLTIDELLIV